MAGGDKFLEVWKERKDTEEAQVREIRGDNRLLLADNTEPKINEMARG